MRIRDGSQESGIHEFQFGIRAKIPAPLWVSFSVDLALRRESADA